MGDKKHKTSISRLWHCVETAAEIRNKSEVKKAAQIRAIKEKEIKSTAAEISGR